MSKDPQDFDDFETDEFEAMPEEELTPEPVGLEEEPGAAAEAESEVMPTEEAETEAVPAEAEEDTSKKGKKGKKAKKAKAAKDSSEAGGFSKLLGQQFPDVYSVMLVLAFVAIVVAIAVLTVELSRYDFDIKPANAMLNVPSPVAAASSMLA